MSNTFELPVGSPAGTLPVENLHALIVPAPHASVSLSLPASIPVERAARPPLQAKPLVSFVVSTHNRRDVLLRTLSEIDRCGLRNDEYETLVVDNASTDGTSDAVRREYPMIHLMHEEFNAGPVSKNVAIKSARGRYVVFLDDDSFPSPGSVTRMMQHFEADPALGAAVFTVTLPDGSRECSAYPNVFIGCGTGFRRRALEQVGGLPADFFMQAEEYDLSLRLLAAGWEVKAFDDLHVSHLKTPAARSNARTMMLDVRNNVVLITRYFPGRWVAPFVRDWLRRYRLIAHAKGQELAYYKGLFAGVWRTLRPTNRRPVDDATFERLVRMTDTQVRLGRAKIVHGLRRVLFVDFGKNMLPYFLAARNLGIDVVAIADPKLAGPRRKYRKIRIVDDVEGAKMEFDGVVVSNLSPVHAAQRRSAWRRLLAATRPGVPVIDLFEDERYAESAESAVTPGVTCADPASRESRRTVARSA
jgi:GT2 family glycosyltransferase